MTIKQMKSNILKTAKAVRAEFAKVKPKASYILEIHWSLPSVAINLTDEKKYFFQGEEASNLLAEAVDTSNKFNVGVEEVLLWMSQSWG